MLLKEINLKNSSKILDAGCGTGNFLEILSVNKTLELYGIDISPRMLEIAKKKLKNKAKLNLIDVEKIGYRNKFDYIFSIEAFHHFSNQEIVMRKFFNALKKKGKLMIVDFDFSLVLNWIFHIIEPGNSKMNSKKDFHNLFKKHNFKNIKQKRFFVFVVMTLGEK